MMAIRSSLPCHCRPFCLPDSSTSTWHTAWVRLPNPQTAEVTAFSRALQMLNYDVESVPCMVLLNTAGG